MLERDASTGARASAWYLGHIGGDPEQATSYRDDDGNLLARWLPGPITQVDISSMYPTLLRDMRFPVKLRSYTERISPRELLAECESVGVIACVTIRTEEAEYPTRHGQRVVYPIGQFTSCLTGPELVRLSQHGSIVRVHRAAFYQLGRPFTEASQVLLDSREAAKAAGNRGWEASAKLVANSLAGKLAQRRTSWSRDSKRDISGKWGDEYAIDAGSGNVTHYRYLCGLCYRQERDKVVRGPYTFAFAYLVAYGRSLMRSIREVCPPRSVVAQDTDGLWVLPAGRAAIREAGLLDHTGPGCLRVVQTCQSARFIGPRHYVADDRWTLSGFANPLLLGDGKSIVYDVRTPLLSSGIDHAPQSVVVTTNRAKLGAIDVGGFVRPDGWVDPILRPYRLTETG